MSLLYITTSIYSIGKVAKTCNRFLFKMYNDGFISMCYNVVGGGQRGY